MSRLWVMVLALLLAACNLAVPQVTPTVAPTLTPSRTPEMPPTATAFPTLMRTAVVVLVTPTETETPIPTQTRTPQPSPTDLPTETPSATATGTPPPTATPTWTPTSSPTPLPTETETPALTPTRTPTETPLPSLTPTPEPSNTPSETPMPTETATGTPPPTMTPTWTLTPPPTETETPRPTQTRTPQPSLTNTPSATPTLTATATGTPPPTATPTWTPLPSFTPPPTASNTPRPTRTPTETPLPSLTPTPEPSNTPSETPTPTATATGTPPPTETATPTDTATATPTNTTTPLPSDTPTELPTETPVPSVTPLPLLVSDTPTPTPSVTRTASPIPLISVPRPVASPTPTRTLSPAEIAALATPLPLTQVSTPTTEPTPALSPTPGPTIDATPTFVGGEIPITLMPFTPLPGTALPQPGPLPSPTATALIPTLLPGGAPPVIVTIPAPNERMFIIPETISYTLSSGEGVIGIGRFTLENFTTELLAQNPANPNQYIVVNNVGQMHFISDYAHDMIVQVSIPIFTQFTYAVSSREENNTAVAAVEWSQDGTLAFIVDGDRENFDGVWIWTPPQSYVQSIRDCPPEPGCQTVLETSGLSQWESRALDWSPDSQKLLVTLYLPDQGRGGLIIVDRRVSDPERIPGPVLYFDSGSWSADGSRIVVSGRAHDGTVVLGSVLPDGSSPDLTDMGAYGYTWTQDAIEVDGQIFALGSRNGPGSPQSIVSRGGEEVVGPIGAAPPERVTWSPDGRAALVITNDGQVRRYYIASIDRRTVLEISEYVANGVALSWVSGEPPALAPTAAPPTPEPPPVEAAPPDSSALQPGESVQVLGVLNMRAEPNTGASVLRVFGGGEVLTVLSGPVEGETFQWYQVQTADGMTGWVAGVINGVPSIAPVVAG